MTSNINDTRVLLLDDSTQFGSIDKDQILQTREVTVIAQSLRGCFHNITRKSQGKSVTSYLLMNINDLGALVVSSRV